MSLEHEKPFSSAHYSQGSAFLIAPSNLPADVSTRGPSHVRGARGLWGRGLDEGPQNKTRGDSERGRGTGEAGLLVGEEPSAVPFSLLPPGGPGSSAPSEGRVPPGPKCGSGFLLVLSRRPPEQLLMLRVQDKPLLLPYRKLGCCRRCDSQIWVQIPPLLCDLVQVP